MGAKKIGTDPKEHIDFDSNAVARHNLLAIINEEARNLYPSEMSWFLGYSLSYTYENVPRVRPDGPVRYCPKLAKDLKNGSSCVEERRSLKIESKKSIALSRPLSRGKRKVRATLCL